MGIDHRGKDLQRLLANLKAIGLDNKIDLLVGDHTHLHGITGLQDTLRPGSDSTFDVVFAPTPLPLDPTFHQILRHWAPYLTRVMGRMVV